MRRRSAAFMLCLMFLVLCFLPAAVRAEGDRKVVRVGWYDTPYNSKDAFGRRTGYAYEYQRKIAAYTGWKYEYVEGNWAELLQMLRDGRIDLLSDVSFVEDRTEYMLYAGLPMGQELYFLYISPDSRAVLPEDYSSLDGKTVGVTRGSVQRNLFLDWAEEHGVTPKLVELDCSDAESMSRLAKGEFDAFVTIDIFGDSSTATPVWKIGSSDFYFAVSKGREDLLAELDAALNRIQDENKYYNEQLSAKYFRGTGPDCYLTADEKDWLESHGPIRVGYQDNYLAFCARDPATGGLTGALKDCLSFASGIPENAAPEFEAFAYPTAAAAMEALSRGDVDCVFPANLTAYDGETASVILSPPLMRTEMDAVVRDADQQDFLRQNQIRIAVNRGNPNYEAFLREHFPSWTPVYFSDTPACLEAVAAKNADCLIISNYRYRDVSRRCEQLNLKTVYTGVDMDYCLAMREGDTVLYSILSRLISRIPDSAVNAALTYYSVETGKRGFLDILADYPAAWLLAAVFALALILLALRNYHIQKKLREHDSRS